MTLRLLPDLGEVSGGVREKEEERERRGVGGRAIIAWKGEGVDVARV